MRPRAARAPLRSRSSSRVLLRATAACEEKSASRSRSSGVGCTIVSTTSAPAAPPPTKSGAPSRTRPPASVTVDGIFPSITVMAVAARAARGAGAGAAAAHGHEPALLEQEDHRPLRLRRLDRSMGHRVEDALHRPGGAQSLAYHLEKGPAPRPPALGERPPDLSAELLGHEGLGQVVEGALAQRLHRVVDAPVRGHDEDRQAGLALMRRFHELEAAHRLHAQVEERDVEALFIEEQHGGAVALGQVHVEPHRLEPHLEHLEDARIVVDDEGAPGAHAATPSASAGRPAPRGRTTNEATALPPLPDSPPPGPPSASPRPSTRASPRPEPPRPR